MTTDACKCTWNYRSISSERKDRIKEVNFYIYVVNCFTKSVFIKVMNDELFSDLILSRKTRDFDVFGCPFPILSPFAMFAR